jgi:dCMP deaminase
MSDDLDKLKYRNEIEVMSRLRNYKVDDLYNESVNTDVSNKISGLYSVQDLYMYNDNPTTNDIAANPISWDSYFMNVAILTSKRSSDVNTKVGAVLVDASNRIIGCGYNGFIKGSELDDFPNNRDGEWLDTKYPFVVHAEANALLNTTVFDLTNSKLYCTLFPCNDCVKLLLQKGISEIIYLSDKHHNDPPYIAARKLLEAANIKVRQYNCEILL